MLRLLQVKDLTIKKKVIATTRQTESHARILKWTVDQFW